MTRLEALKARMAAAEERGLFASPVMHSDLAALIAVAEAGCCVTCNLDPDDSGCTAENISCNACPIARLTRALATLVKEEEDDRPTR